MGGCARVRYGDHGRCLVGWYGGAAALGPPVALSSRRWAHRRRPALLAVDAVTPRPLAGSTAGAALAGDEMGTRQRQVTCEPSEAPCWASA